MKPRGAATLEFQLVAIACLLPLALSILQVALLYAAKHTLNHATFLAARAGAVAHGSRDAMRRHLAKGLAPLYASSPDGPPDAGRALPLAERAWLAAYADVVRPDRARLVVLNPTPHSFADFEARRDGIAEIPNDALAWRELTGLRSRQTLRDANVLKIRVDWCAELVVPLVDRLLTATLRRFDLDPFRRGCYLAGRMPLRAYATVHAFSPLRREALGL